ncbi:hypothetical protein BDN70DRAFT_689598 [Pholiota conissans]|uniref:Uncharacterized protein n=1 Tax=Pholiota conissans TaxID=109636 RepID=A0A9P5YKC5_9AGAR|nr:hypothetical protein BDN70DRAFT_689598 [Pholiota conissans]
MKRLGRCQGPLCARACFHANDDENRWTPGGAAREGQDWRGWGLVQVGLCTRLND